MAGDDPHVAWGAEWGALVAYINGPGRFDPRDLADIPEAQRLRELEEAIADTVATTTAGLREQVLVLAHYSEDRGLRTLLAGLDAMCGA